MSEMTVPTGLGKISVNIAAMAIKIKILSFFIFITSITSNFIYAFSYLFLVTFDLTPPKINIRPIYSIRTFTKLIVSPSPVSTLYHFPFSSLIVSLAPEVI